MGKGISAATAALNREIARLRRLAASVPELAPKVAEACVDVIAENVLNNVGPDGVPWPAAKGDNDHVLAGPRKGLSTVVHGSLVVIRLDGTRAFHHRGQTRGNVARPILPTHGLPQPMTEAISRVARKWFEESGDG